MHFIVLGAGAIGGVIGGRLAQHGHDVTLVARGAHLETIQRAGLRLDDPDGSTTLPIAAVGDVGDARTGDDVILLATKGQDTPVALASITASFAPDTPIVCAQNGVSNEREVLRRFANAYGMCVMLPATHIEPGVVQASSAPITGLLDVGRYPGGVDDTARGVAAALSASTFDSHALPDVMRWKYCKLLMNLGNGVDAMCIRDDDAATLVRLARKEGIAVIEGAGIDAASREEDAARRGDLMSIRPIAGQQRGGGSTWQSLARGTGSVEVDHLNGEIVLLARLHGLDAPVNALLQRTAGEAARAGVEPNSIPASDLLAQLGP